MKKLQIIVFMVLLTFVASSISFSQETEKKPKAKVTKVKKTTKKVECTKPCTKEEKSCCPDAEKKEKTTEKKETEK